MLEIITYRRSGDRYADYAGQPSKVRASIISCINIRHDPQPEPARHAAATSSTYAALISAITASIVSSETPKHVQMSAFSPRNSSIRWRRYAAIASRTASNTSTAQCVRPSGKRPSLTLNISDSSAASKPCRSTTDLPTSHVDITSAAAVVNPHPFVRKRTSSILPLVSSILNEKETNEPQTKLALLPAAFGSGTSPARDGDRNKPCTLSG